MKLAYLRWSELAVAVKDSWRRRAGILNRRPNPDKCTRILDPIIQPSLRSSLHYPCLCWGEISLPSNVAICSIFCIYLSRFPVQRVKNQLLRFMILHRCQLMVVKNVVYFLLQQI